MLLNTVQMHFICMNVQHSSRNRKCPRFWSRENSHSLEKKTYRNLSRFLKIVSPYVCHLSVGSLPAAPSSGAVLGSLFSGLGNSNITISLQNFTVSVGLTYNASSVASSSRCINHSAATDLDVDSLMDGFDLDELLSI